MSAIAWVDVFASAPMTGNPLAVVLDADDWPGERMQAFAAELGISETTFVTAHAGGGAGHRVRIFTPLRELALAGHPLVGTAWVLHASGRIGSRARLATDAGPLEVRVRGKVATVALAAPEPGPLVDGAEAAAAAGIAPAAGPPAQVWSVGVPQLMLAADGEEAVADARPDHEELRRLAERDGWLGVSVYAARADGDGRVSARVRHFAPLLGVAEDPVTGSAAGGLGALLAAAGMGTPDGLELVVRQGTPAGRGGEVAVRVACAAGRPARVQVGGRVVPLFEGRVLEPWATR